MYQCKFFRIEELVDKATFDKFGILAWQFFNGKALMMLDGIRAYFGQPMTVNNWHESGQFQFRGLRPHSCTVGAEYGMHRFGGAFDCDIKNVTAEEARQRILKDKDHPLLKYINCIEANVNWLHVDVRNIADRILIVRP